MAKTADYKIGEFVFARGWYMIVDASKLAADPMPIRFFARDMVLYRGESGKAYCVNAYCAHMGAHIGMNTTSYIVRDREWVEGESIRCPFHGWRYGPDGQCNHIPYTEQRIPKAAKIDTWPVVERAGVIWVWYDEAGGGPTHDLPAFEPYDDPAWVRWIIDDLGELDQHPIELLDNISDHSHFVPVHGSNRIAYFINEYRDHVVHQLFGAGHRTLISNDVDLLELDTWYTGPGILQARMHGDYPTHMLIAHTPIDDGRVHVWHALMVKTAKPVATEEDVPAARAYQEASRLAFAQDFEIWQYKAPCFAPMLVRGDGPTDKTRLWIRQFYNPVERAAEYQKRANGRYVTVDNRDGGNDERQVA